MVLVLVRWSTTVFRAVLVFRTLLCTTAAYMIPRESSCCYLVVVTLTHRCNAVRGHRTSTDAPSILRTSSILGVSSTGRMSCTEGLNTASTGIISSRSTVSTGVSAVSNPEILRV